MQNALVLQSPLIQRLATVTNPQDSKEIENIAAAGRAYAKEQHDYETFVQATYAYILARRKTTELIRPHIRSLTLGRPKKGDQDVTLLADFGFTNKQWSRRLKELDIPEDQLEEYFNDAIAHGWHPSLSGFVKNSRGASSHAEMVCPNCGAVIK